MKRKTIPDEAGGDPLVLLSEAIRILKADPATAWMPYTSIRNAVAEGKVFSKRTPAGKFSRYYVRIRDIVELFNKNVTVPSD